MQAPHTFTVSPWPWLPPELVSQILEELWALPLAIEERSAVFKNACLVNHAWLVLFLRVAMRHVHLPSPLDPSDYLRLLHERTAADGETDPFTAEASRLANHMCRSITFDIDGRSPPADDDGDGPCGEPAPEIKLYSDADTSGVSTVLYMVSALDRLPNLRHVALRYTDWGYDDVFAQLAAGAFPRQATQLSVEYAFTAPALAPLAVYLKALYTRQDPGAPRGTVPGVRHLAVGGAPAEFVADMLEVCTGVETLELVYPSRLYVLAPLPASVRTVVVRQPGRVLGKGEMHWWTMGMAVESGLFTCGEGGRIVIRSGTPDPVAFTSLRRHCRRFGVELAYVREEEFGRGLGD